MSRSEFDTWKHGLWWPLVTAALREAEMNDPWSLLAGQPSLFGLRETCLKTKLDSTWGMTDKFICWSPQACTHTCVLGHKTDPQMTVLLTTSQMTAHKRKDDNKSRWKNSSQLCNLFSTPGNWWSISKLGRASIKAFLAAGVSSLGDKGFVSPCNTTQ